MFNYPLKKYIQFSFDQFLICFQRAILFMLGQNNEQRSLSRNGKIFFMIFAYFAVNIFINWIDKDSTIYDKIINKIETQKGKVTMEDFIYIIQFQQSYEGVWTKLGTNSELQSKYLSLQTGIFEMKLIRFMQVHNNSYFDIVFNFVNGQFIDDGGLEYQFKCSNKQFNTSIISPNQQVLYLNNDNKLDGKYDKDDIFVTKEVGPVNSSTFNISFQLNHQQKLDIKIILQTQQVNLTLSVHKQNRRLIKNAIFAIVMFVVSFGPFTALIEIIGKINDGTDSGANYSLITVCITSMWDTVICLVAVVFAFSSQQNLILFILPAFLMCLIFTNLQPKLMILIFETLSARQTTPSFICKFNLLQYSTLILIYPLIILTNFNRTFFVMISCLMLPQIYLNGVKGIRPEPESKYYRQFLLYRFILIFYLKCYPYNIFRFKPDYFLGLCCFFVLALQYSLIYIQKIYGPKKFMPKFMLPKIYNYSYDEEMNLQQNGQDSQCSICLTNLYNEPPPSSVELDIDLQFKIMRTPCKHRYHTSCLIEWMKIKQDCPQCRAHLPSYQ